MSFAWSQGPLVDKRMSTPGDSYGELFIKDVEYGDAGRYTCTGTNRNDSAQAVSKTFSLSVECTF